MRWFALVLAVIVMASLVHACEQEPRRTIRRTPATTRAAGTQPATMPQAKTTGMGRPAPSTATAPATTQATTGPSRPVDSWTVFRSAFREEADAIINAEWTGGRRLEVQTDNVSHLTLDFRELPQEAPKGWPWNLQIDGQGIEVTGARGPLLHLVRSPAGRWEVDREAYKK